jgi:hypothetical protein
VAIPGAECWVHYGDALPAGGIDIDEQSLMAPGATPVERPPSLVSRLSDSGSHGQTSSPAFAMAAAFLDVFSRYLQ